MLLPVQSATLTASAVCCTATALLMHLSGAAAKIGLKAGAGRVGPHSMQDLFLGANVFMNAFGGHTLSL